MALLDRVTLGGGRANRLVIGIYGAGPSHNSKKTTYVNHHFREIITAMGGGRPFNHGSDAEIYKAIETESEDKNRNVVLIGYSMGGACAIRVANELVSNNIKLHTLITIDPVHIHAGMKPITLFLNSVKRKETNYVGKSYNYYQHSVRATARLLPTGENPYWGCQLSKQSGVPTVMHQQNLTVPGLKGFSDSRCVTHLNIVKKVFD